MRIIVNGQQAFGKAVLEAMLERGDDVVAVFCAPDKEGRRADPIKDFALEKGLPLYQPNVIQFVPEEARDIPTHGSICFHPSLLPKHRGPSSINWPIIWGAKTTGLTIFYPNDGLDEGAILLQKEVEITDDDTLGTVYFDKIFPLGVQAVLEAADLIKAGTAPRIEQDHSLATYESWCRKDNAGINWQKPFHEVYNLIRGTDPQPGAWTVHKGKTLQVYDAAKLEGDGGVPGEVVEIGDRGIVVAASGGRILVGRVRPDGGKKMTAADYVAESGLAKGERLG
jgi:methionyl-tRNA formyltransferase